MTRAEEEAHADALQRDRAYVLHPHLDPRWEGYPSDLAMFAWRWSLKLPASARWFAHGELPRHPEAPPPVLFDGPPLPHKPWPAICGSWDSPGPCDPVADIRRAMGRQVDLLAAHRLEGRPGLIVALIPVHGSGLAPFPAAPGSRVRAEGLGYRVADRKVVQPSHGPVRVALILVPEKADAPALPKAGAALIALDSHAIP